jgi:glyoxylase-like metal-dependent hydrolase (beta-lactamase superfamily II)
MNIAIRLCIAALLLCATAIAHASDSATASQAGERYWHVSDELQIRQLAPDLWEHTSWHLLDGNRPYPSNGLIVRDGDSVTLIDTAWGVEPTRQLIDWIDATLKLPIAHVIPTHFHDDRIGGWPELAVRDIVLAQSPRTQALAAGKQISAPHDPVLDGLTQGKAAQIGAIEVFYPGPAHSGDNLVVWFPKYQLLFGGCMIKSMSAAALGNVADADPAHWPQAVRNIQARYPQIRTVIPGHFESGGPELLDHTLALLRHATAPH